MTHAFSEIAGLDDVAAQAALTLAARPPEMVRTAVALLARSLPDAEVRALGRDGNSLRNPDDAARLRHAIALLGQLSPDALDTALPDGSTVKITIPALVDHPDDGVRSRALGAWDVYLTHTPPDTIAIPFRDRGAVAACDTLAEADPDTLAAHLSALADITPDTVYLPAGAAIVRNKDTTMPTSLQDAAAHIAAALSDALVAGATWLCESTLVRPDGSALSVDIEVVRHTAPARPA